MKIFAASLAFITMADGTPGIRAAIVGQEDAFNITFSRGPLVEEEPNLRQLDVQMVPDLKPIVEAGGTAPDEIQMLMAQLNSLVQSMVGPYVWSEEFDPEHPCHPGADMAKGVIEEIWTLHERSKAKYPFAAERTLLVELMVFQTKMPAQLLEVAYDIDGMVKSKPSAIEQALLDKEEAGTAVEADYAMTYDDVVLSYVPVTPPATEAQQMLAKTFFEQQELCRTNQCVHRRAQAEAAAAATGG